MIVAHLTASTFLGGPERQMLGLARALDDTVRTLLISFSEGGRCRAFLSAARRQGTEALALQNDTPHFQAAIRELTGQLGRFAVDLLCCHGYKANLLGRAAARRAGIPVVAVSRGWTGENLKVRLYEAIDRLHLRCMDQVVCVSEAQAAKVRRAGVPAERCRLIANAIDPERFGDPDPAMRNKLNRLFRKPPTRLIGAAGRLSPEKGFHILIDAAARMTTGEGSVGFVVFGEGPCRAELSRRLTQAGLAGAVVLAGHRADLDRLLPALDLFVLPSLTEGLPNVVLESFAAGVPVVATAAGGTPELVIDGETGFLAEPNDADSLAAKLSEALDAGERLAELRLNARQRVLERFTFAAQAEQYRELFVDLSVLDADDENEGDGEPVEEHHEEVVSPATPAEEVACVTQS